MKPETVPCRKPRCPKCKRRTPVEFVEYGVQYSTFSVDDGRRDLEGYHFAGCTTHVKARCACGHLWRLRGAVQVTSLDLETA